MSRGHIERFQNIYISANDVVLSSVTVCCHLSQEVGVSLSTATSSHAPHLFDVVFEMFVAHHSSLGFQITAPRHQGLNSRGRTLATSFNSSWRPKTSPRNRHAFDTGVCERLVTVVACNKPSHLASALIVCLSTFDLSSHMQVARTSLQQRRATLDGRCGRTVACAAREEKQQYGRLSELPPLALQRVVACLDPASRLELRKVSKLCRHAVDAAWKLVCIPLDQVRVVCIDCLMVSKSSPR